MHSPILLGSLLTIGSIFRACQAMSVGYVLEARNVTGACKDVAQFRENFEAIAKNIPRSADGKDLVVRVPSSGCRVLHTAISALESQRFSNLRLWLDFDIPTIQESGDSRNVTVNNEILRFVVDDIRVETKYGKACNHLAGVSLEHYGNLNSQDIAQALNQISISAPIGFNPNKPEACRATKTGFKTSADAWLSQYTELARNVEHVAFPHDVSSEETGVRDATSSLLNTVDRLKNAFPSLPIVVAGTGWSSVNSAASTANEQLYWQQFNCPTGEFAKGNSVDTVYWDSIIDDTKSNGLLNPKGKPKFLLQEC
ncbi:hypothetical protein BCR37DRAFT_385934 [Protomyces lactucae-debilis]|uniref:Glycoside hydrolase superfamily n=1 Tax=Protomyces lactucae-debilis TaxID=2754530 RepID=A0A1Y2FNK4_PROLT|nr:uncharacterized protein BCR37DRAFT_385934 [Protomyces lactucae-debilis]ORY85509.1 hypothetical protein BCR37DRAFT_385934 [Protomyces lactucae-debilis]